MTLRASFLFGCAAAQFSHAAETGTQTRGHGSSSVMGGGVPAMAVHGRKKRACGWMRLSSSSARQSVRSHPKLDLREGVKQQVCIRLPFGERAHFLCGRSIVHRHRVDRLSFLFVVCFLAVWNHGNTQRIRSAKIGAPNSTCNRNGKRSADGQI